MQMHWRSVCYFTYNGVDYLQPSSAPAQDAAAGTNNHQSSPDGTGEDPRIKSAKDFNGCCTEVIASFTALRELSGRPRSRRCQLVPSKLSRSLQVFDCCTRVSGTRGSFSTVSIPVD